MSLLLILNIFRKLFFLYLVLNAPLQAKSAKGMPERLPIDRFDRDTFQKKLQSKLTVQAIDDFQVWSIFLETLNK